MSESTPVELIVAAFRQEQAADEALDALVQAKRDRLVKIREAAVVRRDAGGKLHIKERGDLSTGGGAASGAAIGAVVGLFGGPIGALIGGAAGAAIGGLAGRLIDTGIPDDRLRQIGEALQPGTSAIVAIIEHTWVDDLRAELTRAGGDILTQAISSDIANQLAAGRSVAYGALATDGGLVVERTSGDGKTFEAQGIVSDASGAVRGAFAAVGEAASDVVAGAKDGAADATHAAEKTAEATSDIVAGAKDGASGAADATKDAAKKATGG